MVWRGRLLSISCETAQLESRFRLRNPKNRSKIVRKETFLFSDNSTCSKQSSCSNLSSKQDVPGKHVHFNDEVVLCLPSLNIPTDDEAAAIWFTTAEITNIKNELRNIWKGSHTDDQDFIAAVDLVQKLFNGQVILSEDTKKPEKSEKSNFDDAQMKQIEIYKECARILARNEGRGLERMHYGKSTFSRLGAKSIHVQRFVQSVLELQDRMKDCEIDSRSDAIAAQCMASPSIWWARLTAEVDAEISQNDAASSTDKILQNLQGSKCTELFEV